MAKNYTVARTEDGTIQITYTIPFTEVQKAKENAAVELGKDMEIPGFRKGMAPLPKLLEKIPAQTLIEKALNGILPKLFGDTIDEEKLKPIAYPKFELLKADENEDWQIGATTAEMPEIDLGDYKAVIKGATTKIWKPGDDKKETVQSHEQKEQEVIKTLLSSVKVKVPKILLDEEVNSRLSKLLEQIDKLGLTLDSYLASIGKKIEEIRSEYEKQAVSALSLDFILVKISALEGIKVTDEEISEAINVSSNSDPELAKRLENPEQKRLIESILIKRNTLNKLISFV